MNASEMRLQSDYTFRLGKPPRIPIPSELRALGRRNRAAGFAGLWYVFEGYAVRDGVLVSEGKIARLSAPAVEFSLPGELAKLSDLKVRSEKFTDALVAFAARYGNLGYSHLAPFEKRCGGDPVYWVKAHARTVADALEIINRLGDVESARRPEERRRARKNLRSCLELRCFDPRRPRPFAAVAIADQVRHKFFFTAALLHDPVRAAHQYLRSLINPNIREVARQLYEAPQGKSQSFFCFGAMIEVVYWHLANALQGGEVRHCAECRHPFISTDRRQRFCPPPAGAGRSRCASRFHIRTFRRNAKRRRRQKEARR